MHVVQFQRLILRLGQNGESIHSLSTLYWRHVLVGSKVETRKKQMISWQNISHKIHVVIIYLSNE